MMLARPMQCAGCGKRPAEVGEGLCLACSLVVAKRLSWSDKKGKADHGERRVGKTVQKIH